LDFRLLNLIATVIGACDRQPGGGSGHPPTETIRIVGTLRRFLREGTPWRGLSAAMDQASGSTLHRCLARCAATGRLAKGHALLELPPNWWTPLLSSAGSGKVSNGPGTASFYG
jgi:hypothetical protein